MVAGLDKMEPSPKRVPDADVFNRGSTAKNVRVFEYIPEQKWVDFLSFSDGIHSAASNVLIRELDRYQFKCNVDVQVVMQKEDPITRVESKLRPWFRAKAFIVMNHDEAVQGLQDAYVRLDKMV